MSVELGRRLIFSGAAGASEIQAALFHHLGTGAPFVRALVDVGAMSERGLEEELRRATTPPLESVVPLAALVDQLPSDLCRRLMCVPIRQDPRTGTVDLAVVDPFDAHAANEMSFHLKTDVRPLRGTFSAIEQALARIDKGEFSSKVIVRKSTPPPAEISSSRPPSGPPIPLVRKSSRRAARTDDSVETLGVRDIVESVETLGAPDIVEVESVEVLGVRDIVEQMEGDGGITDELGQPILPLRTSKVPRAPGVPKFGAPSVDREQTSRGPETSRGPFSPRAPVAPFADIDGVLAGFQKAQTRDEVVDGLIAGMSTVARRVGAFAVKKRGFRGIACNADFGEANVFREIEIPTDAPTVLGIATSKGTYLGPLPETPPHEELLRFMHGTSGEVAAVLVSIAGRPAVILFADALGDTMIATKRAEELGREASAAFSRILTEAKGERRSGA